LPYRSKVKLTEVCPARHLLGIRPGRDPQRHRRMPQVVDAQPIQPAARVAGRQMRCRNPASRNVPPCRPTNTRSSADPGRAICSARASTTTWGARHAGSQLGSWRPEMQVAADLGDDLCDLHHPQVQVDAAAAKPSHLADSKAAKVKDGR
jgi:hypothetical protein